MENKSPVLCKDCKYYKCFGLIDLCSHPQNSNIRNVGLFNPVTGKSIEEAIPRMVEDCNAKLDCTLHEKAEPKKSFFQKLREKFYVK